MKISVAKYGYALVDVLERSKNPKEDIARFLRLLRRRKIFKLLPKILRAFEQEWLRRKAVFEIDISAPQKFEASVTRVSEVVAKKLEKTVITRFHPEDSLIGGVKIRFNDILIDASVKNRILSLASVL